MLVEWNHYITGIGGAGVDPYYEIFYGPLDSIDDDPVSTATSLSLIPGVYILIRRY